MTKFHDEMTRLIAEERERIDADFEARGGSAALYVMGIASMCVDAHEALDRCEKLTIEMAKFGHDFIDAAYIMALRERGYRVEK